MQFLKKLLKPFVAWMRFHRECYLDGKRYVSCVPWPGQDGRHSTAQLESNIIRRYHVIEKGLSMPDFRPRFGEEMVRQLVGMLNQWNQLAGACQPPNSQITAARAVLRSYAQKHLSLGVDVSDILGGHRIEEPDLDCAAGGIKPYQSLPPEDREALLRMLNSRCSVRHFDQGRSPDRAAVERAVSAAIRSPSVCNRQTWRAHLYEGEKAQKVLALQDGNRGFGHTIPAVFVVSSDLRYFTSTHERYQAWIDGGMFAMSLLLGLQAEGFGAVAMNWCVLNERDQELRRTAKIPDCERIIMMIGFGYPADGCMVPLSLRRPLEDILRVH